MHLFKLRKHEAFVLQVKFLFIYFETRHRVFSFLNVPSQLWNSEANSSGAIISSLFLGCLVLGGTTTSHDPMTKESLRWPMASAPLSSGPFWWEVFIDGWCYERRTLCHSLFVLYHSICVFLSRLHPFHVFLSHALSALLLPSSSSHFSDLFILLSSSSSSDLGPVSSQPFKNIDCISVFSHPSPLIINLHYTQDISQYLLSLLVFPFCRSSTLLPPFHLSIIAACTDRGVQHSLIWNSARCLDSSAKLSALCVNH